MLFSTVLIWLLIAVAFVVALPALWLLSRGLWPARAEVHRQVAGSGIFSSVLLGLLPLAAAVFAVVMLSRVPRMGALAALTGGLFLLWGFLGAGGIATLVGERLWPGVEPWRQTKHGGMVLVCCALLPVVGWLVLLPLLAVAGGGIHVRSWFWRTPASCGRPLPAPPAAMSESPPPVPGLDPQ